MSSVQEYDSVEPSREEVGRLVGATVLEFGTPWCGYCRAAQPIIAAALSGVATFAGSFTTAVFLNDGKELVRSVRPWREDEIRRGLDAIS